MAKELTVKQREQDTTILQMKEVKLKFETELNQMQAASKQTCVDLWKKDAIMTRIQSENEALVAENR